MSISRRQAAGNLLAILAAPRVFLVGQEQASSQSRQNNPHLQPENEPEYDLEWVIHVNSIDTPEKIPIRGDEKKVRADYFSLVKNGKIPFSHLDAHLYAVASNLFSDQYYVAGNFNIDGERGHDKLTLFSDSRGNGGYKTLFAVDSNSNVSGLIQITELNAFVAETLYDGINYSYIRVGDKDFECWAIYAPFVGDEPRTDFWQTIIRNKGEPETALDILDFTGIRGRLTQGLQNQILFVDKDKQIIRPQFDAKGRLIPPYSRL